MSDSNQKLYIYITDKRMGDDPGEGGNGVEKTSEKDKSDALGDYAKHQFFNLVHQTAVTAVNESITLIGSLGGDYATQRKVQAAMSAISSVKSIAESTLAGAKMGGIWGAVIGAGVAIVGQGITTGVNYYNGWIDNQKTNREIDKLRVRAGLNSTTDGSRGTEN